MTDQRTTGRPAGYLIGAPVNAVLLWLILVWPDCNAVPFLTGDMTQALGWVAASLVAGIAVNAALSATPAGSPRRETS